MTDVTDSGLSLAQELAHHAAVMAAQSGNWPKAATQYRKNLETIPIGSSPLRYFIFSSYTSIFRHNTISVPDKTHMKFLRDRAHDPNEPTAIRCLLALTRGLIAYGKGDRNKAAKYYQTAVDMDAVMSHTERMAIIYVPNHATGKYKESCIDEYHDDFMEKVRNNLAILKGQTSPMNVVDPTHLFQNQINFNKGQTLKDQERLILAHQWSLELGCHSCQKSPPAVDRLKKCSRCHLVRYCSSECQTRDWKKGQHRLRCRERGSVVVGDIVKVQGLTLKPEMNNKLMEIRNDSNNKDPKSRLTVGEVGDPKVVSIKRENLRLILPIELDKS